MTINQTSTLTRGPFPGSWGTKAPLAATACFAAVGLTAVALMGLTGCGGGRSAESVRVDGSSTVFPITEAVAEEFQRANPGTRVTVGISGTGGGFEKLAAGEVDICDASRRITDAERKKCEAAGVETIELRIAFDGIAIVVHPENDWLDSITVDQLGRLWQPESSIQKWQDLNPDWPDEEIKLYGPGTDSGTFDYFTENIVGETGASRGDYTASEDDNVIVRGVSADLYALGYFGFAYYAENQDQMKLLAVESEGSPVRPSVETIRSGQYRPLSRPLYVYVRRSSLERETVESFVRFYLEHADELASEVGYVAVSDDVAAENEQVLEEAVRSVGSSTGQE